MNLDLRTGIAVDDAVDEPIPTSGTVDEPRPTSTAVEEPIPTSGRTLKRQAEDDGEGDECAHVYRQLEESRKREREGEGEPRNVKPALHIQANEEGLEEMYDVVEVFSPPRVCDFARDSNMRGGWSHDDNVPDPVTGRVWELRRPAKMRQVRRMVREDAPLCLIASPPCTKFSQLQNLGNRVTKEEFIEAKGMVYVSMEL